MNKASFISALIFHKFKIHSIADNLDILELHDIKISVTDICDHRHTNIISIRCDGKKIHISDDFKAAYEDTMDLLND